MLKILGVIFLSFITLGASAVVGTGAYVYSGGIGVCEVDTPEVSFTVPFPMRLADIALSVARFAMPADELRRMREEVAPFQPMLEALLTGIADIPDGTTLVSVETPTETVHVGRHDGDFRVDVDTPDAVVHVRIPASSIKRLGRSLGRFLSDSSL